MHNKKWMVMAALIVLIGCKGKDDGEAALTTSKDNLHFENRQFGLTVEKPSSWYSQSLQESLNLQSQGTEMMSGNDKNMKAMLNASLKGSLTLFSFFEVPPGTPGKLNPSVVSTAEYVVPYPGIKTGCDYLASVKQLIANSQVKMQFTEGCQTEKLGSSTFGMVESSLVLGKQDVHQRYWACRKGDHVIGMVQTYYEAQSEADTTAIVKSIKVQCDS
jgi:hypothetical protein